MVCVAFSSPSHLRIVVTVEKLTMFGLLGKWRGAAPVPDYNLDTLEERLQGDEKDDFLRFLRRMLCWQPEERATAKELLFDPWLMEGLFK